VLQTISCSVTVAAEPLCVPPHEMSDPKRWEKMNDFEHIKGILARLEEEVYHAHSVHKTFERLFFSSKETQELVMESDAGVFQDLYVIYLNYISIVVARILDPESTGKKKNLSLFYLIQLLKESGADGTQVLFERLSECKKRAYNFTEPRNQVVAHLDLEMNLPGDGKCIPSFMSSEFDEAYKTIGEILNEIRNKLDMPPSMYDWGLVNHGHGRKLISRLEIAHKHIYGK
jgi:hypothetical protein